jgi:hypothetical protein
VPSLAAAEAAIVRGNDDEDVYRWPLGLRTPAIGFTHTYRPGRRFGEFGFPSARDKCARLFAEGKQAFAGDRGRGAHLLGRACHLLVYAAVPARTHGVWHYLGDPMERWIEENLHHVKELAVGETPPVSSVNELVERLAAEAVAEEVDGTRTLHGWVAGRLGWRRALAEEVVAAQGRRLFPLAVASVARLMELFAVG